MQHPASNKAKWGGSTSFQVAPDDKNGQNVEEQLFSQEG
jgi:hypothetical protein